MSIGFLGRDRTYMVVPRGVPLKLPTDVLGVTCASYDAQAPNIDASLGAACSRIQHAFQESQVRHSVDASLPCAGIIDRTHHDHRGELASLIAFCSHTVTASQVIRRNWTIDFSYSFAEIEQNVILETIVWDYEFLNISPRPIRHPLRLYCSSEDTDTLISYTKMDASGRRQPALESADTSLALQRTFGLAIAA